MRLSAQLARYEKQIESLLHVLCRLGSLGSVRLVARY